MGLPDSRTTPIGLKTVDQELKIERVDLLADCPRANVGKSVPNPVF
jgi:hypothetical protein